MSRSRFRSGIFLFVVPLVLLVFSCPKTSSAPWTAVLDPSRAIDWTNAGFTIPTYSAACATQPSLVAGSGSASANTTAIQNALNSCDSSHNVVNIPAGTYYVAGVTFGAQGQQVLRGAGADQTSLIFTAGAGCGGLGHGVCMMAGNWTYSGSSDVLSSGAHQCSWSAGYAQGSTSITLSNCGSTPPVNQTIILDQANDTSDTGGVFMCDGGASNCTYEGVRNADGRVINGNLYSEAQAVLVTGVTSLGGGAYTVTISPGVYSTNVRSSQAPGAWFPGFVKNDGVENMSLDVSSIPGGAVNMFSCYECWATGLRMLNGERSTVLIYQSAKDVVRSNYFYGAQSHYSTSYNIETDLSSDFVIDNNIMQQTTTPLNLNGSSTGAVVGYNFAINQIFGDGSWSWPIYASHATANNFNLFEGNIANGITMDDASGPSDQNTVFRNLLTGKQPGTSNATVPLLFRAGNRNLNFMGNVLGTSGYHTSYQAYANSTSAFTGASNEYASIYDMGGGGTGDACGLNPGQSTLCDPLSFTTMMRWGNYDVVNGATQWNALEAVSVANTFVNANLASGVFALLTHTLPNSLYNAATPSWWPSGKTWPVIGPDVASGNVGTCSGGTYAGWLATTAGQCAGGTLSAGWASHAISNPAMDCYLNTMSGPANGSGAALTFNAASCYSTNGGSGTSHPAPPPPTGVSGAATQVR